MLTLSVKFVVVAIVEPQVRFPAGTPGVCLTQCQLWHSANGTIRCAPGQENTVSLPLPGPLQLSLQRWNLTPSLLYPLASYLVRVIYTANYGVTFIARGMNPDPISNWELNPDRYCCPK